MGSISNEQVVERFAAVNAAYANDESPGARWANLQDLLEYDLIWHYAQLDTDGPAAKYVAISNEWAQEEEDRRAGVH